jgi:hypothetical protein
MRFEINTYDILLKNWEHVANGYKMNFCSRKLIEL